MLKPYLKEARDGLGGELDNGRVHHRLQVGVVRRGVHCPLPGKAVVSEVVVEAGDAVAGVARLGVDEGHDRQNAAELGARVGALDQVKDVLGEGVEEGVELLGVKLPQLCRDVREELPAKKKKKEATSFVIGRERKLLSETLPRGAVPVQLVPRFEVGDALVDEGRMSGGRD